VVVGAARPGGHGSRPAVLHDEVIERCPLLGKRNATEVGPVALKDRHGGQQAAAFRFGFGE
jgi:hypothetical protein